MTVMPRPPGRRDLWLTRGFYLFWFAGLGFITPFLTLYYLSIGLTGTEIGLIGTLSGLVTLVAAPLWTARYARLKQPAPIFRWVVAIDAMGTWGLLAAANFLGLAALSAARALVSAGISPIMDGMALTVTRALGVGWGGVRLFGSLGWVIFVLLAGALVERFGLPASLIGSGALTLISAALLIGITPAAFAVKAAMQPPALRDILSQFRTTPRLLGTAVMIGLIALGAGGAYQYEGALLKDLGATDFTIGVAGMLSAVVEIPFMGILDRLMRRVSAYRLLIAGMLIYVGLRGIVFLFPSVALILLAAAGIGISYSLLIIPLTRFIADQAGEARTPLMLAFINVTLPGVIGLFSAPLTGWLYDALGARALYGLAALTYMIAALALTIAARWPVQEPASIAVSG